jgi:hypothetical protein
LVSELKIWGIKDKCSDDDPKTMISSADVQAAIGALDERDGPDVPGRSQLAWFLDTFGGSELGGPDRFLPADEAALKAAILKGIDSPVALEGLPEPVQAGLLDNLAFGSDSSCRRLGFSTQTGDGLDFSGVTDANARSALQEAVNKQKPPKRYGSQPDTDAGSVQRANLNGELYGYSVSVQYSFYDDKIEGLRLWIAVILANASGQIVGTYSYTDINN